MKSNTVGAMKDKKEKKQKSHKDDKRSERKIRKKAKKKEKKKREKRLKEQMKSVKKVETVVSKPETALPILEPVHDEVVEDCGPSIGKFSAAFRRTSLDSIGAISDLMNRAKCPETKEQWDKRQSQIKRVVDPETGRTR